jgi:hypothetical protein
LNQLNIRDNWPLVTPLILLASAIFIIRSDLCLPKYWPQPGETINYDVLQAAHDPNHSNIGKVFLFIFLNIVAITTVIIGRRKIVVIPSLVTFDLFVGFVLFATIFCGGTTVEATERVEFNNHTYQLSLETSDGSDFVIAYYMVYQCDLSGVQCAFIKQVYAFPALVSNETLPKSNFMMDADKRALYVLVQISEPPFNRDNPKVLIAS